MSMNAEIKAQWTAALRGGEYVQGHGQLRRDNEYCCLGVLCDLAVNAGVIPEPTEDNILGDKLYGATEECAVLPLEVREWAGLDQSNPEVNMGKLPHGVQWDCPPIAEDGSPSLANMNDGGTSFAVIADVIAAQL